MSPLVVAVSQVASNMALLPLGWLVLKGRKLDIAWWLLAGAFAVSWLADTAANWFDPWIIGAVYPVSQAAIVAAVFLDRRNTLKLILILLLVGVVDVFWKGVDSPDILLRTVAWLSIVGIAYPLKQLGTLRVSLLVSFGVGWLAWMWYAMNPGWPSWIGYQSVRLVGILLFCWAATSPLPRLRIISA